MSTNRESIAWQAEDGTWSMGMFEFHSVNQDDEGWDYEWDVEYNYSRFHWVTRRRHATAEDAEAEWMGSNPGPAQLHPWSEKGRTGVAKLDAMHAECAQRIAPFVPSTNRWAK